MSIHFGTRIVLEKDVEDYNMQLANRHTDMIPGRNLTIRSCLLAVAAVLLACAFTSLIGLTSLSTAGTLFGMPQ